jgi:DNA-binding transcriptional ArsR family regulator
MDALFSALGHETRLRLMEVLYNAPGLTHSELLPLLGIEKKDRGQLTKLLEPLEDAGLVKRVEARYELVDRVNARKLLIAAADLDVAAQRTLAERQQQAVAAAAETATRLRRDLGEDDRDDG